MFTPRHINKDYVLVRINAEVQLQKRLGTGLIANDPKNTFMLHNQQCGEIVAIGSRIKELLPVADVGDTLLFHHSIEGSYESKNGKMKELDLMWLLHEEDGWRYYAVKEPYIYGVVKEAYKEAIFMMPEIVFATPKGEETDDREAVKVGKLFLFKNYKETRDTVQQRIQLLQAESMGNRPKETKERIMREMEHLTNSLNKYRLAAFSPLHFSKQFWKDCGRRLIKDDTLLYGLLGDRSVELQVTDITYGGKTYNVLRTSQIFAIIPFKDQQTDSISQEHYLLH